MGTGYYKDNNMAEACGSLRNLCIRLVLRYPDLIENGLGSLPLEINQAVLYSSIHTTSLTTLQHVLKYWPLRVVHLRGAPGVNCDKDDDLIARAVSGYISARDENDVVQVIDIRNRNLGE